LSSLYKNKNEAKETLSSHRYANLAFIFRLKVASVLLICVPAHLPDLQQLLMFEGIAII